MTQGSQPQRYLDLAFRGAILLLAISAPVSIAATQISWSLALLFWLIRLIWIRPTLKREPFDLAVVAFVGFSLISSFFSYEPEVSLRKMVSVSLVSIAYLVYSAMKDGKMRRWTVGLLLASALVSAIYTLGLTAVGRNLKVSKLAPDSPLITVGVKENDTIISANGVRVNSPEELAAAVAASAGIAKIHIYRYELFFDYDLPRATLPSGMNAAETFGIADWSRGRDVRAAGFYGHYTTYAEALQLIASLALGMLVMAPGGLFARSRLILAASLAAFCAALFLTVTRASWAGFAVSAALIVLLGASRKAIIICILCAIPIAAGGLYYLQQKRNVAFVDPNDASTTWRTTVWREGFTVLVSNPRHLAVGIGMDSLKTHWQDWGMFDNGNLALGHMHSTPLQIAFERGVPALLAWVVWMFYYLRMLWKGRKEEHRDWFERGVLLGALGGTFGFLSGGLVHNNWGDSEVAMIFYLIMGVCLSITLNSKKGPVAS